MQLSLRCRLVFIIFFINVAVAPCTCMGPTLLSKPEESWEIEPEDFYELRIFTKHLSKRLFCVESILEDIIQRPAYVESILQDIKQIPACVASSASHVENMEFENRPRKNKRDLSDQIDGHDKKLKVLNDEVEMLKDEVAAKFSYIKDMQKEHKELQRDLINLKENSRQHSQLLQQRSTEASRQMSQHDETLRSLNVSLELLNRTLISLNLSVENRVIATEHNLSVQIIANHKETETLKDEVQKLNASCQTNMKNFEEKLGEQSQLAETNTTEVVKQMIKHTEILNILNVSVGNIGSSLNELNVSVENIDSSRNELKVYVESLNSSLNKLNVSVETFGRSINDLDLSVERHDSSLNELNMSLENLRSSLNVSVENLGSSLNELYVSVENHCSSLNELNTSVVNLGSSLNELNASVENHCSSLNELNASVLILASSLNELNPSVVNLSSSLNELNVSVKNLVISLKKLNLSVENQGSVLNELTVSAENLGSSLSELNVSVGNYCRSLYELNVSVENLGSNVTILNKYVDIRVRATENNLLGQIDVNNKQIKSLKDDAQTLNTKLQVNLTNIEEKLFEQSQYAEYRNAEQVKQISQQNESLNCLNMSLGNLGSNLHNLNVSVGLLYSMMKHLTENVTGISIETIVLDQRTENIEENIFNKGSLTFVIMINTTLLVMVIIYLVANRSTNRHLNGIADKEQQHVNQNPVPYSTAGRILIQVPAIRHLERKLCVISFYEETHPLHMKITQSATQELNIEVLEFTIKRHEIILECPPVSLYFLFVDFNERNVILEDPTLGLGDLRLTTVQALQKMGGRIIVFYVRDPNSKQLNSTQLYNEHLASVTRQKELSNLNRLSRFISAYDQLTENQKAHLRHTVAQELNVR